MYYLLLQTNYYVICVKYFHIGSSKMGPAHSTVVNKTTVPLCVISFNMSDLIYKSISFVFKIYLISALSNKI